MMQTLQQQRAAHALAQVQSWKAAPELASKLKARAKEFPFMIHANGLGQAAAFFKSKGAKDGHAHAFDALQSWLRRPQRPLHGHQDLLDGITKADLATYRAAQAEALQYMEWVKKLASAYLHDQDSQPESRT